MAALRIREDYRTLTGPEKAAIMMLALGEEHAAKLFALMDDEEIRELSQTMANLGTVSSTMIERLFVEFAEQISSTGSLIGTYESTERLLHEGAGQRQGQPDHGGDPRSGRPHHVGQARQRERGGARQLPEERIPADRRGGAVQDQGRPRRPRAGRAAGRLRDGSRHAHAAHGVGAEGSARRRRAHAAHRVHVEPRAHQPSATPTR